MTSSTDDSALKPRTVDEARDAVERSRERISTTLDQLEDRIVEKKHELQEKVDVFRPVKEQIRLRPFTAVAVAVGVGALLGSLGGDEEDEAEHTRRSGRGRPLEDDERRELRAWRRERRNRLHALSREQDRHDRHDRGQRADGRFDNLKGQLIGAVTTAVTAAITSRVKEFARGNGGGDSGRSATA